MTSIKLISEEEITPTQLEQISKTLADDIAYTGGEVTYHEDTDIEWEGDTKWNVPIEALAALCKRFNLKARAVGREDGVGFVQVVCIDESGTVTQDDEITWPY